MNSQPDFLFALLRVKSPCYPMSRRLWAPSRSGRLGDRINRLLLSGVEPQIVQPTAWSLYRVSLFSNSFFFFFFPQCHHVYVYFVVLPPGHGSSVTDFWGWDVHEAQLRCPDDVSGDIGGWSARRALKPKLY